MSGEHLPESGAGGHLTSRENLSLLQGYPSGASNPGPLGSHSAGPGGRESEAPIGEMISSKHCGDLVPQSGQDSSLKISSLVFPPHHLPPLSEKENLICAEQLGA